MSPTPSWRTPGRAAAAAALLMALTACDRPADESGAEAAHTASDDTAGAAVAFSTDAGFPLPFRTRVPRELAARVESSESGGISGAVRFTPPTDTGAPTFLRIVVLGDRLGRNDAVGLVRSIGTDFGVIGSQGMEYEEATPPPGHEWAFFGIRLRGVVHDEAVDGWISLGERAGRFFYLMALYPASEAQRMEPMFGSILESWTWLPIEPGGSATPLVSAP